MIFVGFEVSDTVCELVLKVVVAASLVSFSSFADVTAETVTAVVVWLTAEVSTLTDLSAVSAAFPQADKNTAQSIKINIALFISSRSLSSNISYIRPQIYTFCKSSTFVTRYTANALANYILSSGSGSSSGSDISSSGVFSTSISVC